MADEMTQEQLAEAQRKNCIFCKIVAGDIESKKIYEDEKFLAILDIRPASPGHVLFLPKSHIPILPLLSEEDFFKFFETATTVGYAVQEAMISQRITMLTASGYAAGQQVPHLVLHIIPREKGDGLDMLDLETQNTAQPETLALTPLFEQATVQALQHRKRADLLEVKTQMPSPTKEIKNESKIIESPEAVEPIEQPEEAPQAEEFDTPSQALQATLAMTPDLRKLIIAQPEMVIDMVQKSPKLSKLFEGVNIKALSLMLQRQESARATPATQMSETQLFTFIDGNEGLRTWLLDHPDELAARVKENPRLQQFFAGADIREVAKRYRAYRQAKGDA